MAKKAKKKYTSIGGQALMEGIMMRGPKLTTMAVRRADGSIYTETTPTQQPSIWGRIPFVRGIVNFVQSMAGGSKMLMRSADIAIEDEERMEAERKAAELAAKEQADASETIDGQSDTQETEAAVQDTAESVAEVAAAEVTAAEVTAAEVTDDAEEGAAAEESPEEMPQTVIEIEKAAEDNAETTAEDVITDAQETVSKLVEEADEAAAEESAAVDSADNNGGSVADAVEEFIEEAVEEISEIVETAKEEIAELRETIEEKTEKVTPEAWLNPHAEDKTADVKKSKKDSKKKEDKGGDMEGWTFLSLVLGVALAALLFVFLPTWCYGWILKIPGAAALFAGKVWKSVIEGVIRIVVFLLYILLCTTMKEIRRVFEYHGAEHKTIFCYEAGEELTVENVKKYKRFHPRCGTSFIVLTVLVGIAAGICISVFFPQLDNTWLRPVIKLAMLPLIMGVGYELLKLCGRFDNIFTRIIRAPGLWVQRITTREPDDGQIECAIAALKPVIPENGEDMI